MGAVPLLDAPLSLLLPFKTIHSTLISSGLTPKKLVLCMKEKLKDEYPVPEAGNMTLAIDLSQIFEPIEAVCYWLIERMLLQALAVFSRGAGMSCAKAGGKMTLATETAFLGDSCNR